MNEASFNQSPGDELNPTCLVQIVCYEAAPGLEVGEERCARAYTVKVVNLQFNPRFACNGQQVQDRIGGTPRCGNSGDGVFDRFASNDL